MIDVKNTIAEGHHTLVAFELAGILDADLIGSIKDETIHMLREAKSDPEKWIHGMTKTPSSQVKIFDRDGNHLRNAAQ